MLPTDMRSGMTLGIEGDLDWGTKSPESIHDISSSDDIILPQLCRSGVNWRLAPSLHHDYSISDVKKLVPQ